MLADMIEDVRVRKEMDKLQHDPRAAASIGPAGIKAILNFSPGALTVPANVKLKSVDLTVSLESLSFYLTQGEASGG